MDRRVRLRNLSRRDIESLNRASENLAALHAALAQSKLQTWPIVERLVIEANQAIVGVYQPALESLTRRLEKRGMRIAGDQTEAAMGSSPMPAEREIDRGAHAEPINAESSLNPAPLSGT